MGHKSSASASVSTTSVVGRTQRACVKLMARLCARILVLTLFLGSVRYCHAKVKSKNNHKSTKTLTVTAIVHTLFAFYTK
jgi:hypothetical protein